MKLKEIAALIDGKISGDAETEINGVAGIPDVKEGEITFLTDKALIRKCADSKAACVAVRDFIPEINKPQIIVRNPQFVFAKLLECFHVKPPEHAGVSADAFVSEKAELGREVSVYPSAYIADGAVIGDKTVIFPGVFIGAGSVIGEECIIYPNVTIREKVRIGSKVIIHAGAVIGSDGFGYVFEDGKHYKIPQVGGVVIGDEVEIGANAAVDRATTGQTVIGRGTKIDNLVQVGHNAIIGEDTVIVAHVGVGGSSEIGSSVLIGGQVGIADHIKIDDGCIIAAQAGVMENLAKGIYSGSPAMPHRDSLRATALFARLPELNRKIKELEEKISLLERRRDA